MKYADMLGVDDHIPTLSEIPKESVTTYHRLAATIPKKDAVRWERLRKRHLEGNLKSDLLIHRLTGKNESHSIVKAIKSLFPIHPYTAYLLRFITQHCGSTERVLLHVLHDSEHGFSKFIDEFPQDESGYFFTADFLWDSFKELFGKLENIDISPLVEQEKLHLPVLETTNPDSLPIFKGILLLNLLSRFASDELTRELVFPSEENIAAMFIGTHFEQSSSDILLSLCTDEYLTKTDDARFVINSSSQSSEVVTIHEQQMKDADQFTHWLQTLPFPLASILWLYHVRDTEHDMERCEILLHFFEALAECYAILLFSAFRNDNSSHAESVNTGVRDALAKNHQDLRKSSFGVWVTMTAFLAKYGRILYNGNKEERRTCEELFGTSDKNMLNVLFNRRLIKAFQQTNVYRNSWSGHRGAINRQEARERLKLLEEHLYSVQHIFGETWKNFHLVRPGEMRYEGTCYKQHIEKLTGYSVPFQQRWIETRHPMVYGSLYFFSDTHTTSFPMLPLLKVFPSPKTEVEACYFYNRVEGNRLRFISYHFEPEPEIYEDSSPEMTYIINDLLSQEKSDENIQHT